MPTTRHYGASQPTGQGDADKIADLALWHQLPERGQAASTDRMLDTVQAIINRQATGYEFNKVRDWIRRFPLRTVAAKVESGWELHSDTYKEAVALGVLMEGKTSARVAIEYGTTAETVDVIVRAYRMKTRRGAQ